MDEVGDFTVEVVVESVVFNPLGPDTNCNNNNQLT